MAATGAGQACLPKATVKCKLELEACPVVLVVMDVMIRCSQTTVLLRALVATLLAVKEAATLDTKVDHFVPTSPPRHLSETNFDYILVICSAA